MQWNESVLSQETVLHTRSIADQGYLCKNLDSSVIEYIRNELGGGNEREGKTTDESETRNKKT